MKNKHDEGFSLVELLVSIVILAAIVLPTCTSLVLSYRLNAKSRDMMQAQLAVSSAVETLMAQGIDADRANVVLEKNGGVYDFAWDIDNDKRSDTDDYSGVQITVEAEDGVTEYYSVTVTDDDGLVTVTTQIRTRTGGGT